MLYCAAGEFLGIGIAALIAWLAFQLIGEPQTLSEKLLTLALMIIAGALEGLILGYMQWRVLRKAVHALPARQWISVTTIVAMLAWSMGMLPSLFYSDINEPLNSPYEQTRMMLLAVLISGLFLGALFGLFQFIVLRNYLNQALSWIFANSLAWAIAIGWIFLSASLPSENTSVWTIVLLGIGGGMLAGLTMGWITGYFLCRILRKNLMLL